MFDEENLTWQEEVVLSNRKFKIDKNVFVGALRNTKEKLDKLYEKHKIGFSTELIDNSIIKIDPRTKIVIEEVIDNEFTIYIMKDNSKLQRKIQVFITGGMYCIRFLNVSKESFMKYYYYLTEETIENLFGILIYGID